MTIQRNSKISKYFFTSVKLLVLLVIFYFIYNRLSNSAYVFNWHEIVSKVLTFKGAVLFVVLIAFQFLNYSLEMFKWKQLLKNVADLSDITNTKLLKAVYCGAAIGFVTPDRLGSFVGRFIYLKEVSKTKITATTFSGNYIQLLVTVFFGLFGFLLLAYSNINQLVFIKNSSLYSLFLILFVFILFLLFFKFNKVIQLLKKSKIHILSRIGLKIAFLEQIDFQTILVAFSFAVLRYWVFIFQFYLLFMLFDATISIFDTFVYGSILFIFTTLIPSPLFGNLGTREAVSLLLLSTICNDYTTLIVSLSIWFLNVVLPALIGYWYLRTISFSLATIKNNLLS